MNKDHRLDETAAGPTLAQMSTLFNTAGKAEAAASPHLKRQLEASLEYETQRNVRIALGRAVARIGSFLTDAGITLGHAAAPLDVDDVIELRRMLTDAAAILDGAIAEFER